MKMTIKERGDAMLTAYANKDFERVKDLWSEIATPLSEGDDLEPIKYLHGYENPSITSVNITAVMVESVLATRATQPSEEERMRGQNEILDAKRRLWSLGYRNCVDQLTGQPVWAHMHTALRIPFTGDAFSASFVVDDLGTSVEEYDEKGRPVTRSLIE